VTNLVAIIIAGIGIFYVFGFYPNQEEDLKRSLKNMGFIVAILVLIMIPLASSLISITKGIRDQTIINDTTQEFLKTIDEKITIEELIYDTKK